MSHEPVAERIRRHLIGLKMPRALEALQTVQSQISNRDRAVSSLKCNGC